MLPAELMPAAARRMGVSLAAEFNNTSSVSGSSFAPMSTLDTINNQSSVQSILETRGAASGVVSQALSTSFGDDLWGEQFAAKIQTLVKQGAHKAHLALNPPNLGRIDIQISVESDQVALNFTVSHAAVKDAVDESMARLRDMLQDSGFSLVDAGVTHGDQREAGQGRGSLSSDDNVDEELDDIAAPLALRVSSGALDLFV
jgi:flagellar hook-length control protein FliK